MERLIKQLVILDDVTSLFKNGVSETSDEFYRLNKAVENLVVALHRMSISEMLERCHVPSHIAKWIAARIPKYMLLR